MKYQYLLSLCGFPPPPTVKGDSVFLCMIMKKFVKLSEIVGGGGGLLFHPLNNTGCVFYNKDARSIVFYLCICKINPIYIQIIYGL